MAEMQVEEDNERAQMLRVWNLMKKGLNTKGYTMRKGFDLADFLEVAVWLSEMYQDPDIPEARSETMWENFAMILNTRPRKKSARAFLFYRDNKPTAKTKERKEELVTEWRNVSPERRKQNEHLAALGADGLDYLDEFSDKYPDLNKLALDSLYGDNQAGEVPLAVKVIAYLVYLHNMAQLHIVWNINHNNREIMQARLSNAYHKANQAVIEHWTNATPAKEPTKKQGTLTMFLNGDDGFLWQREFLEVLGASAQDRSVIPIVAPLEIMAHITARVQSDNNVRKLSLTVQCQGLFPIAPVFPLKQLSKLTHLEMRGHPPKKAMWAYALIPPQVPASCRELLFLDNLIASETVRRRFFGSKDTPPSMPYLQTHGENVRVLSVTGLWRALTTEFYPGRASATGRITVIGRGTTGPLLANEVTEFIWRTAPELTRLHVEDMFLPAPRQFYAPEIGYSHARRFSSQRDEVVERQVARDLAKGDYRGVSVFLSPVYPVNYGEIADNAEAYTNYSIQYSPSASLTQASGLRAVYVELSENLDFLSLKNVRTPRWIRDVIDVLPGARRFDRAAFQASGVPIPEGFDLDTLAGLAEGTPLQRDSPTQDVDIGYCVQWLINAGGGRRLETLVVKGENMLAPVKLGTLDPMFLSDQSEWKVVTTRISVVRKEGELPVITNKRIRLPTLRPEYAQVITGPDVQTDGTATVLGKVSKTGAEKFYANPALTSALFGAQVSHLHLILLPNLRRIAPDFGHNQARLKSLTIRRCMSLSHDPGQPFFGDWLVAQQRGLFNGLLNDGAFRPYLCKQPFLDAVRQAIDNAAENLAEEMRRRAAEEEAALLERQQQLADLRLRRKAERAQLEQRRAVAARRQEKKALRENQRDQDREALALTIPPPFTRLFRDRTVRSLWGFLTMGRVRYLQYRQLGMWFNHAFTTAPLTELTDIVHAPDVVQIQVTQLTSYGRDLATRINAQWTGPTNPQSLINGFSLSRQECTWQTTSGVNVVCWPCAIPVSLAGATLNGLELQYPVGVFRKTPTSVTCGQLQVVWEPSVSANLTMSLQQMMHLVGSQCLNALLSGFGDLSGQLANQVQSLRARDRAYANFNVFTKWPWEIYNIATSPDVAPLRSVLWDMIICLKEHRATLQFNQADNKNATGLWLRAAMDNYLTMYFFVRSSIAAFLQDYGTYSRKRETPAILALLQFLDEVIPRYMLDVDRGNAVLSPPSRQQGYPVMGAAPGAQTMISAVEADAPSPEEQALYDAVRAIGDPLGMGDHIVSFVLYTTHTLGVQAARKRFLAETAAEKYREEEELLEEEAEEQRLEEADEEGETSSSSDPDTKRVKLIEHLHGDDLEEVPEGQAMIVDQELLIPEMVPEVNEEFFDQVVQGLINRHVIDDETDVLGQPLAETVIDRVVEYEELRAVPLTLLDLRQDALPIDQMAASLTIVRTRMDALTKLSGSLQRALESANLQRQFPAIYQEGFDVLGRITAEIQDLNRYLSLLIPRLTEAAQEYDDDDEGEPRAKQGRFTGALMEATDEEERLMHPKPIATANCHACKRVTENMCPGCSTAFCSQEHMHKSRFYHIHGARCSLMPTKLKLKSPINGRVTGLDLVNRVISIAPSDPSFDQHHVKVLFDVPFMAVYTGQRVRANRTVLALEH